MEDGSFYPIAAEVMGTLISILIILIPLLIVL
jgi:hypothetical protein